MHQACLFLIYDNNWAKMQERLPHAAPQLLAELLVAYHANSEASKFSQTSYTCTVCFNSLKGARCLLLACGHVFCRSCLEDGWRLYISEGDCSRVGCLDPECVQNGQEANEEEVRRVVTEEEVQRWKWLRRIKILDRGD